jgi:pimeloyl-ACP methyl ester carboxylesterase
MKRDVLFIHGWWGGDWVWSDVVGRFEEADFRPHTLSLPGPGSSQSSFSDHLRYALGAARSIGNPILVGHSAGGLLAMKMSETTRPPACIAITPAAPAGVLPRPSGLLLRFLLAALPSILFGRDFFPRDLLRRIALNRLDPARQDDALERMRPVPASQVRLILPSLVRVDRTRMSSPLLVVGAAKDRLTPVKQTRAIARRYGAEYREYPDSGHFMTLETPCTVLASDLIAWLDLTTAGEKASSTREG